MSNGTQTHEWGQRQGTRTQTDAWETYHPLPPHRHQKPRYHSVFAAAFSTASCLSRVPPLHDAPISPHAPSRDRLPLLAVAVASPPFPPFPPPVAVHTTRPVHASSLVRPYEVEGLDPPLRLPFPFPSPYRHPRPRLAQAPDPKIPMLPPGPRSSEDHHERDRRPHPSVPSTSTSWGRPGASPAGDGMARRHRLPS